MNWEKQTLTTCLSITLLCASCGKEDSDEDSQPELNDTDRNFLVTTSINNSAEISAGTIAVSKATNTTVRAFAQQMITQHSAAQSELKSLSSAVGYLVRDSLDPAHTAFIAQLNALSGRAFDSVYIHRQVIDHRETLTRFEDELDNGLNSNVKAYADTYRPRIEEHWIRADSIAFAFFPR